MGNNRDMADHDKTNDPLTESAPKKERMADQQFGAQAARDQEAADKGGEKMDNEKIAEHPRAGNKEEDLA